MNPNALSILTSSAKVIVDKLLMDYISIIAFPSDDINSINQSTMSLFSLSQRSSPSLELSNAPRQVDLFPVTSELSPKSPIRMMVGRCTQILQQGKVIFAPCESGTFDVAPSHPAGSRPFVPLCNSCHHPTSDHANVSADSSFPDYQSQSVQNSTTGICSTLLRSHKSVEMHPL